MQDLQVTPLNAFNEFQYKSLLFSLPCEFNFSFLISYLHALIFDNNCKHPLSGLFYFYKAIEERYEEFRFTEDYKKLRKDCACFIIPFIGSRINNSTTKGYTEELDLFIKTVRLNTSIFENFKKELPLGQLNSSYFRRFCSLVENCNEGI